MPLVFINYRGSDEVWVAQWLCSELTSRLGEGEVFLDSRSIPPGEDYGRLLPRAVRSSAVLLVVIGTGWDASDPDDWACREIAEAFAGDVRVIPVLVGEVSELVRNELPPAIRRLADLQYLRVRARDAQRDIPRVVDEVVRAVGPRSVVRGWRGLRPPRPG